ncbi:MAG: hypothetical protein M3171_10650 [Actinomycetota bacterium]|nr:hypothetical protein [Actinomycetota bacterium]
MAVAEVEDGADGERDGAEDEDLARRRTGLGWTNWGKKARKNRAVFGLPTPTRNPCRHSVAALAGVAPVVARWGVLRSRIVRMPRTIR